MGGQIKTNDIDIIKARVNILDLAQYLGIRVRGRNVAHCYNKAGHKHGDRHPSLGLDQKHNRYKCFACGVSGDVFNLVMEVRQCNFKEAKDFLLTYLGISNIMQKAKKSQPEPRAFEIYKELYNYCGGLDQEALNYLRGRGLRDETIEAFKIFSIKDYEKTSNHLKHKFKIEDLQKAGLFNEKGNLIFYKHRLIIPFLDDANIVYLIGRTLKDDRPKYLMLSRVEIPCFYNVNAIKPFICGSIYICEGVFDTMIMEQAKYQAVGIMGVNNFKPEWAKMLEGEDVILAFDNDEAGQEAVIKIAEIFKGQRIKRVILPEGIKDITDYYLSMKL